MMYNYLKLIDLSDNQIKQIDLIQNFSSLESLDLSTNQIKEIDSLNNFKYSVYNVLLPLNFL